LTWQIDLTASAVKHLSKLDKSEARRITAFLRERIGTIENPRTLGKPLIGPQLSEFWRYRVGDYRIICDIQDDVLVVLVIEIGNRREIYR
jgi:mRNA interferase RelE/StbE